MVKFPVLIPSCTTFNGFLQHTKEKGIYFCWMKYRFTLLYFLLLPACIISAQPTGKKKPVTPHNGQYESSENSGNHLPKKSENTLIKSPENKSTNGDASSSKNNVTGIWKGYFVQNTLGFIEDKYRFEVQVAEQDNHSLKAVTYSYKTTVFYGKADAAGIFTAKSKNFLLKEIKLTDVKLTDQNSGACLMTCYLDFDKMSSMETLTGDYTSVSIKDNKDCGNGKVYLEKSPVTDFYKEDFLVKRENELKKAATLKKSGDSGSKQKVTASSTKSKLKPGAENNLTSTQKLVKPEPEIAEIPKKTELQKSTQPPNIKSIPKPEIMKTRENEMLKTIVTSEKEFKIELYDNGEIDGDRISVYHNNELIVFNKMLTDKPITFTIHADDQVPVHDFVMVAENMGTIPPNTSLMIITAGTQRYELFVTSTDHKNALVRVEYKADNVSKN